MVLGDGPLRESVKAQRGPESLELTSGRGVAVRSLGLTKVIWIGEGSAAE